MNLSERLSREIERVTILRERYRIAAEQPGHVVVPVIAIMTAAIETGHNAAGNGNVIQVVAAIRGLESLPQ